MSSSLRIIGPDGIRLLAGTSLTSLDGLPPGGVALSGVPATTSLSATLSGSGLALSASSAGGATISQTGGALTLTGTATEVNAALASLAIADPTAGSTVLTISVTSSGSSVGTTLPVFSLPDSPPAFIAPPASLALAAGVPQTLGLTLADDPAAALAGLGLSPETVAVSLIASTGSLLLDTASHADIDIAGNGTGTLVLTASSSDLAGLQAALDAVMLDASGPGILEYVARQTGGALPDNVTSGSLTFSSGGSIATGNAVWAGGIGAWQDVSAWTSGPVPGLGTGVSIGTNAVIDGYGVGAALSVGKGVIAALDGDFGVASASLGTGSTVEIGGALSIAAGLSIDAATLVADAGGVLEAGGVTLGTASALIGFGTVLIDGLDASGAALLPDGGTLGGPIAVHSGGIVDFAGTLQTDAAAPTTGYAAISLAAGGIIEGAGLLIAGNFSESEAISGPGTILAVGPAPLALAAGSLGGGVDLAIAPGAVLSIGTISPLYGVFDATPVTVGPDVTVSFEPGASAAQDATGYASTLGEQGGVLVLEDPSDFAATLVGFAPGDRIALPGLTSLSVFNVTSSGFEIAGVEVGNTAQSVIATFRASLANGIAPAIEIDAAGNEVIGLRASGAELTLNDTLAANASIAAVNGVTTPIQGLDVLVASNGTAGLLLTISAAHGELASNGASPVSTLVLSAANALDLNSELAALQYTAPATGSGDVLDFSGAAGLAGLSAVIGITVAPAGTLDFLGGSGAAFDVGASWQGGVPPANGDVAAFTSHAGAPLVVQGPGVAGSVFVGGAYDFAGTLEVAGTGAGALDVSGGGFALFDANAAVTVGGGVAVGDALGAGTLGIAGNLEATTATLEVAGAAEAGNSLLEITGTAAAAVLELGSVAAGTVEIAGRASFADTTIGGTSASRLDAVGHATLDLGSLSLLSGIVSLESSARATLGPATIAGGILTLSGNSRIDGTGAIDMTGGTLTIGGLATAAIGTSGLSLAAGASLQVRGLLDAGSLAAAGSAQVAGGTIALAGNASLETGALLALAGASFDAASLTIANGATLAGNGSIGGPPGTIGLVPVDVAGQLVASGGAMVLGGSLKGSATIDAGAALDLAGPASGGTVTFAGADAALIINDSAAMADQVSGMVSGDVVDLVGVAPSLVSYAGGTLTVAGTGSFGLAESVNQTALAIGADGYGGTDITVGGAMPCFVRGTRLLTADGYRPVETLRPGDRLVTIDGNTEPVVWIGWRTVDLARDPAAPLLHPVTFAPGAFGPDQPSRPLTVSPLHAIFSAGVLAAAVLLVNGATVRRDSSRFAVTYYHVELACHAVIYAENLPAETYRDDGNRDRFAAAIGTPGSPTESCRPLVLDGPNLRLVRTLLHQRALALGFQVVHGASIEAVIPTEDGPQFVKARALRQRVLLDLPHPSRFLTLRTRTGLPADTDPASEDRRMLGFCAGALRVDGRRVPVWHGAGWHSPSPADRGMWSGAEAELRFLRPARRISIDLLGSVPRWERNPAAVAV